MLKQGEENQSYKKGGGGGEDYLQVKVSIVGGQVGMYLLSQEIVVSEGGKA